ncbi:FAD-dependent oxidoreductase [Candidatus Saccharibacteria bacterium]|nr:MAG: FAD-dependent oxidoreductase [Candidatus Saccharibacteria bacterium]
MIVGGGFGGVRTALELAKQVQLEVTLVSERPDFSITQPCTKQRLVGVASSRLYHLSKYLAMTRCGFL